MAQDLDKTIHDLRPPDSSQVTAKMRELFRQSPLTGCTSLMSICLQASGWNPLEDRDGLTGGLPDDPDHYAKFQDYVGMLTSVPIFSGSEPQQPDVQLQGPPSDPLGGDANSGAKWDGFLTSIVELMPGLTKDDCSEIVNEVKALAHQVFNGPQGVGHQAVFVQHALAVDDGFVQINLYWCAVDMHWVQQPSGGGDGKSEPACFAEENRFTIHRVHIPFPIKTWHKYADTVSHYQLITFQQFLARFALSDGSIPDGANPPPTEVNWIELFHILQILSGGKT